MLQSLKRQSRAGYSFAKINSCTYRIDRPNKLGVGWLMEVAWPGGSRQRWIARIGNRGSEPLALDATKQAAATMLNERGKAEPRDWIAELNRIAANEVGRAVMTQERRRWPLDLVGGARRGSMHVEGKLRDSILETELKFLEDDAAYEAAA